MFWITHRTLGERPISISGCCNEPRIQELADDLSRIGHTPFPLPIGVMLNEAARNISPCIRCDICDGYPCLVNAKADAHIICVEPALKHANLTLVTQATVTRLESSANGHSVTGVVVERDGEQET